MMSIFDSEGSAKRDSEASQKVPATRLGRCSARGIVFDEAGRLLLIRRARPGQTIYWTTPGGGVEDDDASPEAALHRELAEELGAMVTGATPVFVHRSTSATREQVAHYFVARLASLNPEARSGAEYDDASRGAYDLDRVDVFNDLEAIDLRPTALKEFILANRSALLRSRSPEQSEND